jgi:D-sedoheptulose 7-phosphate isomerase
MDVREKRIGEQLREIADLLKQIESDCKQQIIEMADIIADAVQQGNKLMICGNGGSAADAQHFAAEMVGHLTRERSPIPAVAFTTDTSILTSVANDYGFDAVFMRQVEALGKPGDVLMGISTSGNSSNIIKAVEKAKDMDILPVALLGRDGGVLAREIVNSIVVRSSNTQRIQEGHITIIHILCELIEEKLYFT